jgi:hypothetical protein
MSKPIKCVDCGTEYINAYPKSHCRECGGRLLIVRTGELVPEAANESISVVEADEPQGADPELRRIFESEFNRMARRNDVFDSASSVLSLVGSRVDGGEQFVNVFRSLSDKKDILLITTGSAYSLKLGLVGRKVNWFVDFEDIKEVNAENGVYRGYVIDALVIETSSTTHRFQFGFTDPSYESAPLRGIARENTKVAAAQLLDAISPARNQTESMPNVDPNPESSTGAISSDSRLDLATQLSRLAELYTQGMLTESEFANAKAKLIDRDE